MVGGGTTQFDGLSTLSHLKQNEPTILKESGKKVGRLLLA